ncbi:MAG: twin-arginine translocase subunit TatC [Candidatus Shapirobacteria bacterium]
MEKKLKKLKKINNLLIEYEPQLKEIRKIFFRSLFSFIIGASIGLIFNQKIILVLMSLFDLQKVNIVLTSPYQFINLAVGLAIVLGLITTIPVFIFYLLKYIQPALKNEEYSLIKKLIPLSIFLFIFGCFFGAKIEQYVVSLYAQTTTNYSLSNFWDIESFLSQVMIMSVTMGLVFQLPIILTILIRVKILTTHMLTSQRRYVYSALIIFAVLLPPTDILSLIMITIPLFILFEGTIIFNRNFHYN